MQSLVRTYNWLLLLVVAVSGFVFASPALSAEKLSCENIAVHSASLLAKGSGENSRMHRLEYRENVTSLSTDIQTVFTERPPKSHKNPQTLYGHNFDYEYDPLAFHFCTLSLSLISCNFVVRKEIEDDVWRQLGFTNGFCGRAPPCWHLIAGLSGFAETSLLTHSYPKL